MSGIGRHVLCGLMFACGGLLVSAPLRAAVAAQAQGETTQWSVPDFVAAQTEWPQLRGKVITLEGRYAFFGRDSAGMAKCDLAIKLAEGVDRPRGSSRAIELTGTLTQDAGVWTLQVTRVRQMTADLEKVTLQRRVLPRESAVPWFELGRWARERAMFYEDSALESVALDVMQEAIDIAKSTLTPEADQPLIELGQQVNNLGVARFSGDELIFEGVLRGWNRWQSGMPRDPQRLVEVANLMQRVLPGARIPLAQVPESLLVAFRENPLVAYQSATSGDRRLLERLLFVLAQEAQFRQALKADGSNGRELAAQVLAALPERTDLVRELQDRHLQFRIDSVGTATRVEAQQLADDLEAAGRQPAARQAIQAWLAARRGRSFREGLHAVYQVADDYLQYLGDKSTAAEVLTEADERFPGIPETKERLQRLGYRQVAGKWERAAPSSGDPAATATRSGNITAGMSQDEVYRVLGGPTALVRMMTAGDLVEVWEFRDARLTVEFARSRRDNLLRVTRTSATRVKAGGG